MKKRVLFVDDEPDVLSEALLAAASPSLGDRPMVVVCNKADYCLATLVLDERRQDRSGPSGYPAGCTFPNGACDGSDSRSLAVPAQRSCRWH